MQTSGFEFLLSEDVLCNFGNVTTFQDHVLEYISQCTHSVCKITFLFNLLRFLLKHECL